jgi:hypothetical protein
MLLNFANIDQFTINKRTPKPFPKRMFPKVVPKIKFFPNFVPSISAIPILFPKIRVQALCFGRAKDFLENTENIPKSTNFWENFWDLSFAVIVRQFSNCTFSSMLPPQPRYKQFTR